MIIVDTREQLPLWDPDYCKVLKQKLDEGDYTTTDLLGKAHIERKSGNDLYGSIIQGHERFRKEIQRAIDKKIVFAIFVECTKADFLNKRFKGGFRLKTKPGTLAKIINTINEKYSVEFYWCDGRDELRKKALQWFGDQRIFLKPKKTHKSCFVEHDIGTRAFVEPEETNTVKKPKVRWG